MSEKNASFKRPLATAILAAGLGKRMKSALAKPLHPVCGKPMIRQIVGVVDRLEAESIVVVVSHQREQFEQALREFSRVDFAVQEERLGTGHAVLMTEPLLKDFPGDILVVCGDTPLLRVETLRALVDHHQRTGAAATILTTIMPNPFGYGRIVRREQGSPVHAIIEERDASGEEKAIQEVNSGTYVFQASLLFPALRRLTPDNDQNEYYLTDVPQLLIRDGRPVEAVIAEDHRETLGVNSRVQLAEVEEALRERIRRRHLLAGVTMTSPATVFIDEEVAIGRDTVVEPFCVLQGQTRIGESCRIGPGVTLVDCEVADGCRLAHTFRTGETLKGECA